VPREVPDPWLDPDTERLVFMNGVVDERSRPTTIDIDAIGAAVSDRVVFKGSGAGPSDSDSGLFWIEDLVVLEYPVPTVMEIDADLIVMYFVLPHRGGAPTYHFDPEAIIAYLVHLEDAIRLLVDDDAGALFAELGPEVPTNLVALDTCMTLIPELDTGQLAHDLCDRRILPERLATLPGIRTCFACASVGQSEAGGRLNLR
jgi:hypothetical protein